MFEIQNRRYIGNKYKLMPWITKLIEENCPKCHSFFDVFAGTGSVTDYLYDYYNRFIINDFLYSNNIIYQAFFMNKSYDKKKLNQIKDEYNNINILKLNDNYFSDNFGDNFFNNEDARLIGHIRDDIEKKKINYILNNYSIYPKFEDKNEYYEYMGEVDNNILSIIEDVTEDDKLTIRTKTLYEFAEKYQPKEIFKELDILATRKESKDEIFKFISAPIRLEFLTSIALVQNIPNVIVQPNYSIDDEGLPTMTAGGNEPDIVCVGDNYDSLVEVTLMCGRSDQVNNEIIPIRRHLLESKKINQNSFSMLIAPYIHEDTRESAEWYKYKEKLDIKTLTINTFINYLEKKYTLENFLKS